MFKFWKRKKNKHIVGNNNIITVIDNKGNKHIVDKIKGMPAKIIKENVAWHGLPPSKFNSDIV